MRNSVFVISVGIGSLLLGICVATPIKENSQVPAKKPQVQAKTFGDILAINVKREDLFEGDIFVTASTQRNAIADPTARWATTVPYSISGEFSHEKKALIIASLNELEVRTCLKFAARTTEEDYIFYEVKDGCFSSVGKMGGKQIISIGNGCENHRTVIHETLHALGFWHEQSRTDRDEHVQIVWDVIQEGREHNFEKYESDLLDTQGVPYDYDSIMHYHDTAFSFNGSKTIIAPANKTENMGKMDAMSKIDVEELNLLYQCEVDIDGSGYTQWTEWGLCDQNCNRLRQRFCDGHQCSNWGSVETVTSSCESSCEVAVDPDCGPKLIESGVGVVTSPLYPYSYKSHADCMQTIQTPEGSRIQLAFQDMEIEDANGECHYDFLHVYDGQDDTSQKVGTYCGNSLPANIISSGNTLTLKFTSDYSVVMNGFYANFKAIYGSLHICSFEHGDEFCGWVSDASVELQFQSIEGETPSVDTGPKTDHTFGDDHGRYLFLESSAPAEAGQRARIISPMFFPDENVEFCFSLWYNMYGINTGSLSIFMVNDDVISATPLTTISGDKGDDSWYQWSVSLAISAPFKVAIEAVRANGYKGDIGIDDVALDLGKCT